MNIKLDRYAVLLLAISIAILLLHHFYGYVGHYGYDDMEYAFLAKALSEGEFFEQNHYSFRWSLLVPLSLLYKTFGLSDFVSSLVAMSSFVIILIIGLFGSLFKQPIEKTFFAILCLSSPYLLFNADKIGPDIIVASSAFLICYGFSVYIKHPKSLLKSILLSTVGIWVCFFAKGTVLLILPLIIGFCIYLLIRKNIRPLVLFCIPQIGILILFFVCSEIVFDDMFMRLTAIKQNGYLNFCSFSNQPFYITLNRILYEFWVLLWTNYVIWPILFTIFILLFNPSIWKNIEFKFWLTSSIVLLLSANFVSTSVSSYNPLCLDIRHYLFLIPVLFVCLLKAVELSKKKLIFRILLVGFIVFPTLKSIEYFNYYKSVQFNERMKYFEKWLDSTPDYTTNSALDRIISYKSGFKRHRNIFLDSLGGDLNDRDTIFEISDGYFNYLSNYNSITDLPFNPSFYQHKKIDSNQSLAISFIQHTKKEIRIDSLVLLSQIEEIRIDSSILCIKKWAVPEDFKQFSIRIKGEVNFKEINTGVLTLNGKYQDSIVYSRNYDLKEAIRAYHNFTEFNAIFDIQSEKLDSFEICVYSKFPKLIELRSLEVECRGLKF